MYPNGYTALKDISFGVDNAEIFGLLGPNGAGKSTCFNILSRLITKTKGSISLLYNNNNNDNHTNIYQSLGVSP